MSKYEEALERARQWMPNVNQGGHAMLIDIFPELGEGLDPRYGGRKQQPEVDIVKECDEQFYSDLLYGKLVNRNAGIGIARYFFKLGLNAKKED